MVFSSPLFLFLFLPVVLAVYFLLPGLRARNSWLLAVSLDRDEIEAPLNRQRSTVLIAGAALVLLLGVAGFYAWRRERMLRQVREDVLSTRYATAILTLPDGFLRVAASGAIST